jgi:hypothetical protein
MQLRIPGMKEFMTLLSSKTPISCGTTSEVGHSSEKKTCVAEFEVGMNGTYKLQSGD